MSDLTGNGMYYEHKPYKSSRKVRVEAEPTPTITKMEEVFKFYEIYVVGTYEDPHNAFAKALGVTRVEAKELCYRIAYDFSKSVTIKAYFEERCCERY